MEDMILNIILDDNNGQITSIAIYTLSGDLVSSEDGSNENLASYNVGYLSQGQYEIFVTTESGESFSKVVEKT